jgi:hypothetical protein
MSRGISAVDNNVGILVGQERGGPIFDFVGRQINRTGQVRVSVGHSGQYLNELKLVRALDLVV